MSEMTLDNWMEGAPKEDIVYGNLLDKIINLTKINKNGCLIWSGHIHPNGYPKVTHKGRGWYLHRLMWTRSRGEIPKGMYLCHKCDDPHCINLDHLFVG
jgi:hypothetical protein